MSSWDPVEVEEELSGDQVNFPTGQNLSAHSANRVLGHFYKSWRGLRMKSCSRLTMSAARRKRRIEEKVCKREVVVG